MHVGVETSDTLQSSRYARARGDDCKNYTCDLRCTMPLHQSTGWRSARPKKQNRTVTGVHALCRPHIITRSLAIAYVAYYCRCVYR